MTTIPDLVVIYRGVGTDTVLAATETLIDQGVTAFETTMDSPDALETIARSARRFGDRAVIGAGSVLSRDHVKAAADAGASFLLSPHLDPDVVAATKDAGLISVPGAFTPTEAMRARAAGADLVKLFPVAPVGAGYVRHITAPLPDVPLMVSGGITAALGRQCLDAGCVAVATSVTLLDSKAVAAGDWARLAVAARDFLNMLRGTR